MVNWKTLLIRPNESAMDALKVINGPVQLALVVDASQKLIGTVTDGDIRRGILKGLALTHPVTEFMKKNPFMVTEAEGKKVARLKMRANGLKWMPVVNAEGAVCGFEVAGRLVAGERRKSPVVLMAGGEGQRLRPLTETRPKPLLPIGDTPVLEITLKNFIDQQFNEFYISVGYKAEMIQEYFGDGSRFGADIKYLHEPMKMGTAGCLSLLEKVPSAPLVVMNGDLITGIDFGHLLDFHREHASLATICVANHSVQVPFGVVESDGHRLKSIVEKPVSNVFINAGIYVLEPKLLSRIPKGQRFDMPDLLNLLIAENQEVSVFPVREYWLDIGRHEDLERANQEFGGNR